MSPITILIIVAVVFVGLLAGLISFVSISNKNKSKKLQENLEKYKKENANGGLPENIDLSKNVQGESVSEDEIFSNPSDNSTDELLSEEEPEEEENQSLEDMLDDEYPRMPQRDMRDEEELSRKNRDQDFEDFLNEHAFSRKVFDKDLLEQLQEMPPEIRLMFMENIFNKHDDGKN